MASVAEAEGNTTAASMPAKLKHFSAQVVMAPQSAFSHGLNKGGQQSGMSSVTDAGSGDSTFAPAAPGRTATERATRRARMGSSNAHGSTAEITSFVIHRSNDDFAIRFGRVSEVGVPICLTIAQLLRQCLNKPRISTEETHGRGLLRS
jgi:hypothetical protein